MERNRFERVDMRDASYQSSVEEIRRSGSLCHRINQAGPMTEEARRLMDELLGAPLQEGSGIFSPVQIDFGKNVRIGKRVIINHSLTCMSKGGIEIDDDVMIGPGVTLLTANHEFEDHWVLLCGKVHIRRNAWIGANATILPGVTVGENAVVAAGSVVTKDVAADTVVAGNPARVIRTLTPGASA